MPTPDATPVTLATFIAAAGMTAHIATTPPSNSDMYAKIRVLHDPLLSDNTRRAYRGDWEAFSEWCLEWQVSSLPAEPHSVAAHLAWMANAVNENGELSYTPSSISRRLTAINTVYEGEGLIRPGWHPDVKAAMAGIRRVRAQVVSRKEPLLLDDLARVVKEIDQNSWPAGISGHRDVAILTMGMIGAFRRSELVRLRIGDVLRQSQTGLSVIVRHPRGDSDDTVRKLLPYSTNETATCAPCGFARWVRVLAAHTDRQKLLRVLEQNRPLEHICLDQLPELQMLNPEAPLFRSLRRGGRIGPNQPSGEVVRAIVCRRVEGAGMDPAKFAAHSLRSGFFQQALREGALIEDAMLKTGSMGNLRTSQVYRHAAVDQLGL